MKRILSLILIITLSVTTAATALVGCSSSNSGDTLYIYNWSEYIPQEVYDLFEEETGIKVVENTFSSAEEMLSKLVAGGSSQYDIIVASNYVLNAMLDQGLIQEINVENLENFENLRDEFVGLEFDPDNTYTVPYMSTITLIAYNKSMLDELGVEITCFDDLLNPALENNMVVVDDCREIVDIALKAQGEDPDTQDKETIYNTLPWLTQLAANIKVYDSDTAFSPLAWNETAVGIVYNIDAVLAMWENDDIEIAYMDEKAEISYDNFVISSECSNVEAAEQFIDFILRPDIYKICLDEFPGICLNEAALELMDEDFLDNPAANVDMETVQNAHMIQDVGDAAEYYDDVFAQMKN